ncbi:hypothetical protein IEQ34_004804 [Dendrobium chrysotoxum]|uniref:Uncharacterized protein n=1 Tax=Dendrobium chrysotoxum TaxID=161865 RepID=A0AAV7H6E9_DENCH|nr:hypothetical protein IEQ34_004804 [Dendrobium chrysotoxum]
MIIKVVEEMTANKKNKTFIIESDSIQIQYEHEDSHGPTKELHSPVPVLDSEEQKEIALKNRIKPQQNKEQ